MIESFIRFTGNPDAIGSRTLRTVQTRIAQRFKICPASTSGVVYLTNGLFLENEPFFDYLGTQHAPKNSFTPSSGSILIISTFQIGRNQRPLWMDWPLTTKHRTIVDCLDHNPTALTHLLAPQWQSCSTVSLIPPGSIGLRLSCLQNPWRWGES